MALDNSAPILDRVSIIFFNMTDAETTDSLTALSIKLAPVLSEHNDNISLNGKLFKRVNDVYRAIVGFQVGADQYIVDAEIELVLIVGNAQSFTGLHKQILWLKPLQKVNIRQP